MLSARVIPAALLSAVLLATSAAAASVTNRDGSDHKVTVIEGSIKQDHVVKPGGILEGICQKGCLMRLNDSTEEPYQLEGPEVTWIEGGELLEELSSEQAVPSQGGSAAR